jgi:hypothetical protein
MKNAILKVLTTFRKDVLRGLKVLSLFLLLIGGGALVGYIAIWLLHHFAAWVVGVLFFVTLAWVVGIISREK